MEIEIILEIIKNLGFPIFTAVYLMTRFENVIKDNTTAIKEVLKKITS